MPRSKTNERGSIVIIAMLAMVALISLGGLSTLAVRGGLASSGHDRFRAVALYAAESGAAAAIDHLRGHVDSNTKWSNFVSPNNTPLIPAVNVMGNFKQPGDLGNPFNRGLPPDKHIQAWYEVEILNNRSDPNFAGLLPSPLDSDGRIVIRSTGHGPGGTIARIEVEIEARGPIGGLAPGSSYAQEGQSELNSGSDALSEAINNAGDTAQRTAGQIQAGTP